MEGGQGTDRGKRGRTGGKEGRNGGEEGVNADKEGRQKGDGKSSPTVISKSRRLCAQ